MISNPALRTENPMMSMVNCVIISLASFGRDSGRRAGLDQYVTDPGQLFFVTPGQDLRHCILQRFHSP